MSDLRIKIFKVDMDHTFEEEQKINNFLARTDVEFHSLSTSYGQSSTGFGKTLTVTLVYQEKTEK